MNFSAKIHMRAAVIALSTTFLAGCSSEHTVSGPNAVARWKACSDSADGLRNSGRTSLENFSWMEGKLVVDVKDNEYCGGTRIANPRYTVSGNLVRLSWGWELGPGKAVTACTCDFSVRFELANLPAGDYQVQLARAR